jgi:hypothetical protein
MQYLGIVLSGGRGSNLPEVKELQHEKDEFLKKKIDE